MRRFAAVLGLAASLLAGTSAQDLPRRDGPPRARTGSAVIRGRVIAADTGLPIRDAIVALTETRPGASPSVIIVTGIARESVERAPIASTSVDADGRFELRNVAQGTYRLTVRPGPGAARYLSQRYPDPASDTADSLTVTDGHTTEVTIAVPRAGAITGRVYDDRGDPLAFAQVAVVEMLPGGRLRQSAPASIPSRAMGRAATSDDNGAFRLFSLPAGDYLVFAMPAFSGPVFDRDGIAVQTPTIMTMTPGRVAIYYPGTPNVHEASVVSLTAGGEASIEFQMPVVRKYTVRGMVIDPDGAAVPNMNVTLRSSHPMTMTLPEVRAGESGSTREDGTFLIAGVTPGERILSVVRRGVSNTGAPRVEYARMAVTIERDTEITVQLRPSATVEGSVIFEGGEPADAERVSVGYVATGDVTSDGSGSVQIKADRTFMLEHLTGPMLVRASAARWYLKSVTYGTDDITDTPTEFRPGDTRQLIVTLGRQLGVISGTITTVRGRETEGRVVLFSAERALWHNRYSTTKTSTSSDGKFRIEGVRAGRYFAAAIPLDEGEIAHAPAAFYELLSKTGVTVAIAEGQSQTVTLRLSRLR